jgi:hypothetical protein
MIVTANGLDLYAEEQAKSKGRTLVVISPADSATFRTSSWNPAKRGDMTDNDIEQILQREASLNTVAIRSAPDVLLSILDEEFAEVDSTGRIWDAEGVAEALSRNPEPHDGDMESARVLTLSDDVQLLTYSSPSGDAMIRHTSVWVRKDDEWRVVFHQQTRVT